MSIEECEGQVLEWERIGNGYRSTDQRYWVSPQGQGHWVAIRLQRPQGFQLKAMTGRDWFPDAEAAKEFCRTAP